MLRLGGGGLGGGGAFRFAFTGGVLWLDAGELAAISVKREKIYNVNKFDLTTTSGCKELTNTRQDTSLKLPQSGCDH